MESAMLVEPEAAKIVHARVKSWPADAGKCDLQNAPAAVMGCNCELRSEAFFHGNGSINYKAALAAADIARSQALRAAFRAVWHGLKRAAFRVSGAVQR
jgi:hypothetical protein